jgi:hypothetical protein
MPWFRTLDRWNTFASDGERETAILDLLQEFKREALVLGSGIDLPGSDALELLARHHGLPSPLLDWTRSPYIAACFAFATCDRSKTDAVSIFALDRQRLDESALDPASRIFELIDDPDLLVANRRAVQQRGVFLRRSTVAREVEELLGAALFKFRVPATERDAALRDLDQHMVNLTTLFYDLDGAARTVGWRCRTTGETDDSR